MSLGEGLVVLLLGLGPVVGYFFGRAKKIQGALLQRKLLEEEKARALEVEDAGAKGAALAEGKVDANVADVEDPHGVDWLVEE